jgi:hypothetical protein
MAIELRIAGGDVMTPGGRIRADVLVDGGRIAGLVGPGVEISGVGRTVDAAGKLVLPGMVDPHVHTREPGPARAPLPSPLYEGGDGVKGWVRGLAVLGAVGLAEVSSGAHLFIASSSWWDAMTRLDGSVRFRWRNSVRVVRRPGGVRRLPERRVGWG